jgi:L-2-hydroxyglutarate oxidase LhgO
MTETVDCIVIGAGAVGLATARALALAGREVIVVEAADAIGTETSSRNSEVIHAGIYYPDGSLKARLCRRGRDLLYAYLAERAIPHRRCGKLVVASDESERARLEQVEIRARANDVADIQPIAAEAARAMEPNLACVAALWCPSTGIFDSHAYMLSLQGDAEAAGAMVALRSPVTGGRVVDGAIELAIGGPEPTRLAARTVVDAAGLGAQRVAAGIDGMPEALVPPLYYAKGSYFALAGKPPFGRLIYPVPGEASLGTHYLLDMGGRARFGPDVEWVERIDYAVDPRRADQFYAAIRRFWPDLPDGALTPDYAGVRPKLQAPGEPARDFMIQGPETHGIAGLINLFGIESPGLTASLAIAAVVAARAGRS